MKAWVLEKQAAIERKPLLCQELPISKVEKGEIRVKVHACGVCRTDIHVAEGDLPLRKAPLILGHQIVGVVDEVGIKAEIEVFPFDKLPDVLILVKGGKVRGNAVIKIAG